MSKSKLPIIVFITGASAVGKTSYSIKLAKALKTQIVSCDSRQFYKEMSIGTAVPSDDDQQSIKHHFIQHISIKQTYNPGDYAKDALDIIKQLHRTNKIIILVGGPSLYADALLFGLHKFPKISSETKNKIQKLYNEKGLVFLQNELAEKDSKYYSIVDKQNPRRLIRALEIIEESEKPYSYYIERDKPLRPFRQIVVKLELTRADLYSKIESRIEQMMNDGFLREVESLYPYRKLPTLNTIGYNELFDFIDKKLTLDKAISEIKKNTRRFAKRQINYLKRYDESVCLKPPFKIDQVLNHTFKRFHGF